MEFSLNALISVLYRDFNGNTLEPLLPLEFKKRSQFLRRCFNELPALGAIRDNAISTLNRLNEIAAFRDDVVHGYISAYDPNKFELTFISLNRDKSKTSFMMHVRKVTAGKLLELGAEANLIGHDLGQLANGLLDVSAGDKDLHDVLRKL
jgi:hypothetical protein